MSTIHGLAGAVPAIALAAALLPGAAGAFEIYTWVDDEGVVHYSESAPEKPTATPVETLHIASTNSPDYDPDDYHWSILNQAERIGEQWSAIREQTAEREAQARAAAAEARISELERQLADRDAAYRDHATRTFYGPYAFFPNRHPRHLNRGLRPHPTRDPHRPPHTDRDRTLPDRTPRPGWTRPAPPTTPPVPRFSR